ncbi:hypothetical protein Tco_0487107 [Tanacetum coccineum]
MAGEDDQNINNQPPNPPPPTQQTPHTVSTIKLPILKKGEYDIWAMKMEHYLAHIDYPIWEVIQNGNGHVLIFTDTQGQIKILPPKSAEEILARERKSRTTLLMALPEDHLARFHNISDAKEMWDAIKTRFGGNAWNTRNKEKDNGRRSGKQEDSKALVTLEGEDEQRAQLSDASIEIKAYTQALKKVKAQLVAHQQGLGYGDHKYDGILSYENEVLQSVFMNKESDLENQPLYDRFVTAEGMHAIPPPITRNYMTSGPDVELNKQKGKGSSQREIRPAWNNVQRVNHKNQFVPTVVLTRTGKILVSTASASGSRGEYSKSEKRSTTKWVAEKKDMTLIEAARTMLADSFLPNTFWAEAVSTACYKEFDCHFEMEFECVGEVVLSTFELLQMLGFFLQMGFTLILATLDGLDVGLLGDVIGEDECDEDE